MATEAWKVIARCGTTELWLYEGEVWRTESPAGFDTTGAPMGKRWECTEPHFRLYRSAYNWAEDVEQKEKHHETI